MTIKCSCADKLEKAILERLKGNIEDTMNTVKLVTPGDMREAALGFWKQGIEMVDKLLELPECKKNN